VSSTKNFFAKLQKPQKGYHHIFLTGREKLKEHGISGCIISPFNQINFIFNELHIKLRHNKKIGIDFQVVVGENKKKYSHKQPKDLCSSLVLFNC
jgi:hypothetical protein